jgi:glycosyltransferase involved in cell wall biosynthesis
MAEPRIALVHDWLTGMRGGEKVLLEFCRLFPTARIYTLLWRPGSIDPEIESRVHQTSFLRRLPRSYATYRYALPLFPAAVRSLQIRDADLVISSSHAVAKGVRVPPGVPHVSYVHTPMRYLWDETGNYFRFGRGSWWKRSALRAASPYLRRFDLRTAKGVDYFIANSQTVRDRIHRCYHAAAEVIHPPVDTDFFQPSEAPGHAGYDLIVSSLEPYKRIDLALEAFRRLDRPLVIAGSGSLERNLRAKASGNIRFLGRVSGVELRRLYQNCRAVIFPGIDDFGIVPVEALACGKPVVCCGRGGATESITDGETGVYFWPQEPGNLAEAVERAHRLQWNPALLRRHSLQFSRQRFHERMRAFFRDHLGLSFDSPGSEGSVSRLLATPAASK